MQMPEKIVAFEGSPVSLTFYLDTKQCSNKTNYTIKVSRDDNGRHTDICSITLDDKCTVSRHSSDCSCLSHLGPVLFSKNVTSDDNTVYVWRWGEKLRPFKNEKRIKFEVASEPPGREQNSEGKYWPLG